MSETDLHESLPEEPGTPETGAAAADPTAAVDDPEAPEADAIEQHTDVREAADTPVTAAPDDVDPADHADQQRTVTVDDEDDYR